MHVGGSFLPGMQVDVLKIMNLRQQSLFYILIDECGIDPHFGHAQKIIVCQRKIFLANLINLPDGTAKQSGII